MEHADEATTSQIEHQIDYKTPKKTSSIIESEALLAKINILTTRPENQSQNAKVNDYDLQLCRTRWHSVTLAPSSYLHAGPNTSIICIFFAAANNQGLCHY